MSNICIPIPASSVIGVSTTPIDTPSIDILRVVPDLQTIAALETLDASNYPTGICVFFPKMQDSPATYQLITSNDNDDDKFIVNVHNDSSRRWVKRG